MIEEITKAHWSSFVQTHERGNIFQSPEMYEVYQKTKNNTPLIIYIKKDNGIKGILLANILKESSGLIGNLSARSIILGGPLVENNDIELLNLILIKYKKEIQNKAIYTQFRNLWTYSESETNIFIKNGFSFEGHLDIIHDLTISSERQFAEIHPGRRKNIRRAEKSEVTFELIKSIEEYRKSYMFIKSTYQKINLPVPNISFFENAYYIFYDKGMLNGYVAKYKDKIIGVRYALCYNKVIYDWYAGCSEDDLNKYPNDFLPWKIMEWGTMNGFRKFIFGGAGKPGKPYGVRDFKLKFGGTLVNYGRFSYIHKKLLYLTGVLGILIMQKFKLKHP